MDPNGDGSRFQMDPNGDGSRFLAIER